MMKAGSVAVADNYPKQRNPCLLEQFISFSPCEQPKAQSRVNCQGPRFYHRGLYTLDSLPGWAIFAEKANYEMSAGGRWQICCAVKQASVLQFRRGSHCNAM